MNSPLIPIALFGMLVTSLVASIPLSAAGSGFALLALAGFVVSLATLGWWVVNADRRADPRANMRRTADRFDARWGKFERDFWAYVAAVEAEAR
ncbi:MAG: hypothetical protein QOG63_2516 [Thermoleophilaceae bacterium]|jgi:hypothetical protein|nr:hypothetical protein [Thermoleophilaceae bacterium]